MSEADAIRDVLYAERARVVSLEDKIADLKTSNKFLDDENDILSNKLYRLKDTVVRWETSVITIRNERKDALDKAHYLEDDVEQANLKIAELEKENSALRKTVAEWSVIDKDSEERGAESMATLVENLLNDLRIQRTEWMKMWKERRNK